MSEAQFTPGPLVVDRYDNVEGENGEHYSIREANEDSGFILARVWDCGPNPAADAVLFAAAPDLYEALAEAVRLYSARGLVADDPACGPWISAARAALSRVSPQAVSEQVTK